MFKDINYYNTYYKYIGRVYLDICYERSHVFICTYLTQEL